MRDVWVTAVGHAEAWHPYVFPDPELFMLKTADPSPKVLEMVALDGAKATGWVVGSLLTDSLRSA